MNASPSGRGGARREAWRLNTCRSACSQPLRFAVCVLGLMVQGSGSMVQGVGFTVASAGYRVQSLGAAPSPCVVARWGQSTHIYTYMYGLLYVSTYSMVSCIRLHMCVHIYVRILQNVGQGAHASTPYGSGGGVGVGILAFGRGGCT